MNLSIVIPAYNEEHRILHTLAEVKAFVSQSNKAIEVIVVDDGSQDSTARVVTEFATSFPALRLISLSQNRGKGAAVREGMLSAVGELVLFADADGSTPISEVLRLERALESTSCDVAIGSRALRSTETKVEALPGRKFVGRVFNFFVNVLAVPGIEDTQCGFKLFKRTAAQSIFKTQKFPRFSFDLEVLFKARKLGYKIIEVPVNWHHVTGSKVNVIRDGLNMLRDAFLLAISKTER